ncbi:hypothetical protein R2601_06063 [Salipiger bermudensis HTCC2601]|uniref:Uncharacterized protein n=1 Tax=Salipiger bermudensis (strain DSM 26914 / JCM 13377 / KCTC 12554 / HTCC2601) TaxID=314265 RepID=Q0FSI8_SALBH|nr:hypothetical protein R2601_06063 [Salipiger bermudensis HTCC2601]
MSVSSLLASEIQNDSALLGDPEEGAAFFVQSGGILAEVVAGGWLDLMTSAPRSARRAQPYGPAI